MDGSWNFFLFSQSLHINEPPRAAANTAGHALNYAYGRKMNGAHEECRRQGIAFLPIVAETFGGWHPEAGREVKKLGAALARHTGQEEGEAVSHMWSTHGHPLWGGASQM